LCELVELNLIRVQLRRVDPRVPQERAKHGDIATALAEETNPALP
jgi:hypothetical protein